MADYGNYTTYHFDDVDEMSDYESTGAPPPPPPDDDYAAKKAAMVDEVPHDLEAADAAAANSEYDKLNTTMGTSPDVYDDDDVGEDGSVEIPPTKVVEDMMRREQEAAVEKGGNKVVFLSAILCILLSLVIILGAGFGTGAFKKEPANNIEANAVTVDGYTPNTIPGEEEDEEPTVVTPEDMGAEDTVLDPIQQEEQENFDERPSETTTPPAVESSRGQDMREYLGTVAMGGPNTFSDLSSPESLALQWLVLEDPLQLDATNEDHKFQITQRYALVSLWYNSDFTWANETNWLNGDECTWHGISCITLVADFADGAAADGGNSSSSVSKNTGSSVQVVTRINLEGNNVQGRIPADLALLSFITSLNLADNVIEGALPDTLTQFSTLEELYLDRNLLSQDLSSYDFTPLAATLTLLDLSSNSFFGNLPPSLWKLARLELLVIDNNGFTGPLSDDVGQLTALTRLTAGGNKLTGELPATALSQLGSLQVVWLFKNQFTGPLPAVWADSLLVLDVYDNDMDGTIPVEITELNNLQQLVLGANKFEGPIPDEIGDNMRQLTVLNLEDNLFTGPAMPQSLGQLGNLTVARLGNNPRMEPDFLPQYVFSQWLQLEELRLPGLKLRGDLNNFNWRNLQSLRTVDLSNNFLRSFPLDITFCNELEELNLSDNIAMGGNLPENMDALMNLKQLLLANAGLMGNLTASLGSLRNLEFLDLTNNTLIGGLPNLGGMTNAQELKFGTNFFTGEIPESVGQLSRLQVLDLSVNFLRGELPESISNLESLVVLKLGDNANEEPFSGLTGELPSSFSKLLNLVRLELFSNRFTGVLPPAWGALNKLQLLDVEFNPLSGNVPVEYQGMTMLQEIYLSSTDIEGSVPAEVCALAPQIFMVDCDLQCSCCSSCQGEPSQPAEVVPTEPADVEETVAPSEGEETDAPGGRRRRRTA
ncbi:Leucine rich repeat N-terminal domain [Seminavis robusta]|uniref:Leucine rich repeat N-terminal domain n=1 Tax=Seminavis robusta TaxID=568900 RepID=A0A9N8DPQ1_9STRA|nr:Leucine rich repeat N-terminal domain [Seminavis robusta]|eukprot:Sro173_g076150.1 Leucine rich repeat N-terminal domain (937) ;mRNA; r:8236-11246